MTLANNLLVVGMVFISATIGGFIGWAAQKINTKRTEKKLQKNLKDVLDGKRKNSIFIDGKEYDATKFRVRNSDGKEIIIDLKGGISEEDAKKGKKEIAKCNDHKTTKPSRENRRGSGGKKRNLKRRHNVRRRH